MPLFRPAQLPGPHSPVVPSMIYTHLTLDRITGLIPRDNDFSTIIFGVLAMCGRFTLFDPDQVLLNDFGVSGLPPRTPRYNIAPSQPVLTVRAASAGTGREIALLRWGLIPSWSKDPAIGNRLINARSETAMDKPSFRSAFKRHRCLIPANGFYEWQKQERRKQPYYIRRRDGHIFAFAGLWDRWEGGEDGAIESCSILTTSSNDVIAPLHDRMPVIIPPEKYTTWLDPSLKDASALVPLLVPFPSEEIVAYPVSSRVNTPKTDDKECIAPIQ